MKKDLKYYVTRFQHLRRANTKYGAAPHKAVLLLSIIRGIELGFISENKISASLILLCLFKTTWNAFVKTENIAAFALPFFHLKTSKFWHFKEKEGFSEWLKHREGISSLAQIQRSIQYAYLDGELFMLLTSPHSRNILKQALLDTYFPTGNWKSLSKKTYFDRVAAEITENSSESYANNMTKLENSLNKESLEEEMFIRRAAFKREVGKVYNYSCCISGFRVDSSTDCDLLDACHIEPFALSHDDTIPNGLYLCPTLHRAFDRHLISIDQNYKLIVSKAFIERSDSPYSIKQFEGKMILLPADRRYYPSQVKLQKHREKLVT